MDEVDRVRLPFLKGDTDRKRIDSRVEQVKKAKPESSYSANRIAKD